MKCIAIVLSGGIGNRMNTDIPKQYIKVCGKMIVTESIRPFLECELVDNVHIVADEKWHDKIIDEYNSAKLHKLSGFSQPGLNRQLSILNALYDIKDNCEPDDLLVIHDAARPLVSVDLIRKCIVSVQDHDGVMPMIPVKDTLYYSEDGEGVDKLLCRDKIFAGQAPEVFRFEKYLRACEKLLPDEILQIRGSAEPAVMAGLDIVTIQGDERNFKITTMEDFERYKKIIDE